MRWKPLTKSDITILLLVLLAFGLRLVYFSQTIEFVKPGAGSDGQFYLTWAEGILRGNVLGKEVFYALPFYPYFLSLVYLFCAGEIAGIILFQLFLGAINCALIYLLGKRLFNSPVGIIAAIIASAYFMFIFYDRMLLPASLAIFLALLLIFVLLAAKDKPSLSKWIGVGFFLGLCSLASAAFNLLAVLIFCWIICEYRNRSLGILLNYCGCFILSFLFIIGAVTLRNYLVSGDVVFITAHSGINFYLGNNPGADGLFKVPPYMRGTQKGLIEDAGILAEQLSARRLKPSEVSGFWFKKSLNFIQRQPKDYFRLLGQKIILFCSGQEYVDEIEYFIYNEQAPFSRFPLFKFSFIFPWAVLGMLFSWPQRKKTVFLYLSTLSFALATVIFFVNSRYRLISLPFLIIFAAAAIWHLLKQLRQRQYKGIIFTLLFYIGLYLLINARGAAAEQKDNYTIYYNKGVLLSERADYQQAKTQFEQALKIKPADFMSYLGLGNVYYQLQDYQQAIDNYKKALAINPYFYVGRFNLAIIYKELGRIPEAEDEFNKVLRLKPDDYAAYYNLGKIYQEKGRQSLALEQYRRALKFKPDQQELLEAIEELREDRANEQEEKSSD